MSTPLQEAPPVNTVPQGVSNEITLKSDLGAPEGIVPPEEGEILEVSEDEDAVPVDEQLEEGDIPPMSREAIKANEELLGANTPISKPPLQPNGARQASYMYTSAGSTDVSPEDVAASYDSPNSLATKMNSDGQEYENSVRETILKRNVSSSQLPVEMRAESYKALSVPDSYTVEPEVPILLQQFSESTSFTESNRYGAGQYANGGMKAAIALSKSRLTPVIVPSTELDYFSYLRTDASKMPIEAWTTESLQESIMNSTDQASFAAALQHASNYTGEKWKFWSTQGLQQFAIGIDQIHWSQVKEVFENNGIVPEEGIIPSGAIKDSLLAGGLTKRDYINALKKAPLHVQKKVITGLLGMYNGTDGINVYVADLIQRAAEGNPNLALDTLFTVLPLGGAYADVALAAGMTVKASKIPMNILSKKTPSGVADAMSTRAPQTITDAAESAALGNPVAKELLGMTEGQAAMHVAPSSTRFADASWQGFSGVINEASTRATRFIAELRTVYGADAADLVARTPEDVIARTSSFGKASGVAKLAKGASTLIETEGGFKYEAIYRAIDGNGFDTLKSAKEASKQFSSKDEVVKYIYETPTGIKGEFKGLPAHASKEAKAEHAKRLKEIAEDPTLSWSISRTGVVPKNTTDDMLFGEVGSNMVESAQSGAFGKTIRHYVDTNATANKVLHSMLNKSSGEQARVSNLLKALFTGRSNVLGVGKKREATYLSKLNRKESNALAKGMKHAEAFENNAVINGSSASIPLHELEKIPGWTRATTEAFIETQYNAKVMWEIANTNFRRHSIVQGYKTFVNPTTGGRVNARRVSKAEFMNNLGETKASKKIAQGPDGNLLEIGPRNLEDFTHPSSGTIITELLSPYWANRTQYVTHKVMKVDDIVEEYLSPVVLNQRVYYHPRVHLGSHVVMGRISTGEWVAIGMADGIKHAIRGVENVKADPRLMEMFPNGIDYQEVRELSEKGVRGGFDNVDAQLGGVVYGARNDELAYFGDVGADGLMDPIEAMMSTVNKLAVGKKDSEMAYARKNLTDMARAEGIIPDTHIGIIGDDFSMFNKTAANMDRVNAYEDAFRNINAMTKASDDMQNAISNSFNSLARVVESITLKSDGVLSKGAKATAGALRNPTVQEYANIQHVGARLFTKLMISGKPLRQFFTQASSVLINAYQPLTLTRAWRSSAGLDSLMTAMDDVLYVGGKESEAVLKAAQESFAATLGVSVKEAGDIAKHWRTMGGYDAINNHMYAQQKLNILKHTSNRVINGVKMLDDAVYGVQGRLGFEAGEKFAQRVAFLSEVHAAKNAGTLSSTKKGVQDMMALAADKTGNMRSEFRIDAGNGWLRLATQYVTYPVRMGFAAMPQALGGSRRFTPAEKWKIFGSQFALFGASASILTESMIPQLDSIAQANFSEEDFATYQKLTIPMKSGLFGEWAFNFMAEQVAGEESDYDLSASYGTTSGLPFMYDIMMAGVDGHAIDFFMNSKLFDSTRIADTMIIGNIVFNTMFSDDGSSEGRGAALSTSMAGILVPQLDAAWLSYIAYSEDAMVSKKGTPTGEAYSTVRNFMKNGLGVRNASDELAYEVSTRAKELTYGNVSKAKTQADERAEVIYRVLRDQITLKRASGNTALPSTQQLEDEIFNTARSMISYLPPDERYMLRESLKAYHEKVSSRARLSETAPITLAEAIIGDKVSVSEAQDQYDYLAQKYPEHDWNAGFRSAMQKAKDKIMTVQAYNRNGEQ